MGLLFAGIIVGTLGKVVLGITVLMVHTRLFREHRIDRAVLSELKRERWVGIFSILLIVIGFVLEMVFYTTGPFA